MDEVVTEDYPDQTVLLLMHAIAFCIRKSKPLAQEQSNIPVFAALSPAGVGSLSWSEQMRL